MNTTDVMSAPQRPGQAPQPPRAEPDGFAAASFAFAFAVPLIAIVFGHVARGKAKRAGLRPATLATAGTILGYIGLIPAVVLLVILIAAATRTTPDSTAALAAVL